MVQRCNHEELTRGLVGSTLAVLARSKRKLVALCTFHSDSVNKQNNSQAVGGTGIFRFNSKTRSRIKVLHLLAFIETG